MGYLERNQYAVNDLEKLITYKINRGISRKWQALAYSYLFAFRHACGVSEQAFPDDLTRTFVSVRETNQTICQQLRITPRMVQELNLQTLRLDTDSIRKRRYYDQQGRSSWEGYKSNCEHHAAQQRWLIEQYIKNGWTKTRIAQQLGISRKHVYTLLNQSVSSANGVAK
ncbi:hypothetical protein BN997_00528 [Oceanobacillus oncorhynchi]|uniref:Uncharacterized protein n=1 Tax=Oceanobacillus oncorhynchi TaxID=545501 RepID=A0A0A1MLL8_9BACI|nr:helix-turn-helix domain-containing protein [Oceanobacillus oncorhynchi]CEI80719.1 hypothetical protein BN997_00528 [Oceanobacillus oncorhynchi]